MIRGMKSGIQGSSMPSYLLKMSDFFTAICVKFENKLQVIDIKYI